MASRGTYVSVDTKDGKRPRKNSSGFRESAIGKPSVFVSIFAGKQINPMRRGIGRDSSSRHNHTEFAITPGTRAHRYWRSKKLQLRLKLKNRRLDIRLFRLSFLLFILKSRNPAIKIPLEFF